MILKLCRDVMNLEQLIQNGTVMGALTRVLQEEFKKSVDLSFNILRCVMCGCVHVGVCVCEFGACFLSVRPPRRK